MEYVGTGGEPVPWELSASLKYTISSDRMPNGPYTGNISRYGPGGMIYTKDEMLCLMLYDINGNYKFAPGPGIGTADVIVERSQPLDQSCAIISSLERLAIGQNQRLISPLFRRNAGLRSSIWKCPLPGVIRIYHHLDLWRFRTALSNKFNYYSAVSGKITHVQSYSSSVVEDLSQKVIWTLNWSARRIRGNEVPTLRQLAFEKASYAHRAFYQTEHGPMVEYSMANIHQKIPFLVRSFNQPTHKMNAKCKDHMHLVAPAMERLVDFIGVRKHLGKYPWRLMPSALIDDRKTSGGERADRAASIAFTGGKVVHTTIGQKTINHKYATKQATRFFEECKTGEPDIQHPNYKIAKKHEMFYASGEPGSVDKIQRKVREFYIPHAMVILIERALFLFKHLVHRGRTIRIGTTWWWGGGKKFFDHLFTPGCRAYDGDFKSIDKTIKAVLLSLHVFSGTMFVDFSKMTDETARVYRTALRIMSKVRVVKVTRLNGNTWVVMKGVMPSGVFETSDGDSWIVCLLICLWVEWERSQSPRALELIDAHWDAQFRGAIYGDDHVLTIGPDLREVLSEERFGRYCLDFWDMEIREQRQNLNILSKVENDRLVEDGAVFLKRYVIERPDFMPKNVSSIVPWKPATGHFMRIPYSDTGFAGWTRVLVSIIGHAWDSMGTNLIAYQELSVLYHLAVVESGISSSTLPKLIEEEFADERVKTKMLAKMQLTQKDFNAFPSLHNLHCRHEYRDYVTNESDPMRAFMETEVSDLSGVVYA
jgi:hypothetical protein